MDPENCIPEGSQDRNIGEKGRKEGEGDIILKLEINCHISGYVLAPFC